MVLWELTLTTAYFLGLKRTYRLALGIQRRLIGPNYPGVRQFLHRRTRSIFGVAVKVHQNIQQRDIEAGRNLGNWVLRWLDCIKPSAEIRSHSTKERINSHISHQVTRYARPTPPKPYAKIADKVSKGRLLFARWNTMAKYSPSFSMLKMLPTRPLATNCQLTRSSTAYNGLSRFSIFRNDIALLMRRN